MKNTLPGPLSGYRVLDLTRIRSGPTAVRQFADWGADVIKIEPVGDTSGYGSRESSDFQNLHRNKRSITLDLKSEGGRAVLLKMVESADVLIENFRPSVKNRLKIGYEDLKKINPRLVYGSISGFGQTGPYAERPGFDQVAQGMGGLMSVTGLPGQGPVRVGVPISDLAAGLYCAMGVLMALLNREKTGKGDWVQSSLLQSQIALLDFQAVRWLIDGMVPKQSGNDHPVATPMGVFPTIDGPVNIAVHGDQMWRSFCNVIERPELADDPLYNSSVNRFSNRPELNAIVARETEKFKALPLMDALNAAGIPCGPIYNIDQVFGDPQVKHLDMVAEFEHPKKGSQKLLGQPIVMAGYQPTVRNATPDAGEHTDEVLLEFGYDAAEIKEMRAKALI